MICTREDVIASRLVMTFGILAMIIGIITGYQQDSEVLKNSCALLIIVIVMLNLPFAIRKVKHV